MADQSSTPVLPTVGSGREGLCTSCSFAGKLITAKKNVFILCGYAKRDSTFPKYPRLPVTHCDAYNAGPPDLTARQYDP